MTEAAETNPTTRAVIARGLRETPQLRAGIGYTLALAVATAVGRLLVPILVQQIFDRGLTGPAGFRPAVVYGACGGAAAMITLTYIGARLAMRRMVRSAERAIAALRLRTFAHIHRMSIAEQSTHRRGTLVARVTADIDALSEFVEWGWLSWVISLVLIAGCLLGMLVYCWQLALVTMGAIVPLAFSVRRLQRGMVGAYARLRSRVADSLGEVSEAIMGAALVRAFDLHAHVGRRVKDAHRRQYRAEMGAQRYMATIFPVSDLFGAATVAAVVAIGAHYGRSWGLTIGTLAAFMVFVTLLLGPLGELSEVFDNTQSALAGWRKVLGVLEIPIDVVEPGNGRPLPPGALPVRVEGVDFGYRTGGLVLRDLSVTITAGEHVAVVGQTGSGKTTFARLLCRLADPVRGRVVVGGVDLREADPEARRRAVRLVPQDGFLFDDTVAGNVRRGREGASDADAAAAFAALALSDWLASLPEGLATRVGERGEQLSVGERQLIALARAQVAGPGLLVLDEATSAVDPETERRLSLAMERLSAGRTTVTVAHRLSSAESADRVLVFDRGRIVESGTHAELVAAAGVYAGLHASWNANVGAAAGGALSHPSR